MDSPNLSDIKESVESKINELEATVEAERAEAEKQAAEAQSEQKAAEVREKAQARIGDMLDKIKGLKQKLAS
jgi:hypothetical protein